MPGNPVRIGDGCATVSGHKLPRATEASKLREGGSEVKPASQDTGPAVLVLVGCRARHASFSDKEKDEASRRNRFSPETFQALHAPFVGV